MEQLRIQPREGERRCSYCRDALAVGSDEARCPECDTAYHAPCWQELGRCAVKGCPGRAARPARARPAPARAAARPVVLPVMNGLTALPPRSTWPPSWLVWTWVAGAALSALWVAAHELTNPAHHLDDYERARALLPTHWMVGRFGPAVPALLALVLMVSIGAWIWHRRTSEDRGE